MTKTVPSHFATFSYFIFFLPVIQNMNIHAVNNNLLLYGWRTS